MRLPLLALVFTVAVAGQSALGGQTPNVRDTRLLSEPAISQTHVAFVYAGDLWVASLDGSNVRRLTSDDGVESNPAFSLDGRMIAFSAQYDGNTDVFVVSVDGGAPTRLTWHPGPDIVQSFTPDGSAVLFTSPRASLVGSQTGLYTVPVAGGFPRGLPIPNASLATYSPDGARLAYNPLRPAFNAWKHYRGGRTSEIWLYRSSDHATEKLPQPAGRSNDTDPMWIGDVIYFRSDRNGEFNLFAFDTRSKTVTQLTQHNDFPVIKASAGAGKIVYEQAGYLHTFDPATRQSQRLAISVTTDLIETRPRYVKGARYIRDGAISPTGARAVFEFRGEIVTVPAEKGDPRDITNTPGVNERSPAWSPDGQWIAYFSDASGEYELHVRQQDGLGEAKKFKLTGVGLYDRPVWSPDSRKIAYTDVSLTLYWLDVQTGVAKKIAAEPYMGFPKTLEPVWSPDSKWIGYTLQTLSHIQTVYVYSIDQDKSFPVTDGLSEVSSAVFDRSGKYMYLLASTDAGPVKQWFLQSNADMEATYAIYLAVLRSDLPSPLAPESDEEKGPPGETESREKPAASPVTAEPVRIDFAGLSQRIVSLPVPAGDYRSLQTGEAGQLYYLRTADGKTALQRFDLNTRKSEEALAKVDDYLLSADGKKMLYRADSAWSITPVAGKIDAATGRLKVDAIEVRIEPRVEWRQMFEEAWRINRDLFYATNMHGADWPAIKEKYRPFLADLATRADLTRVLNWMVSELAVGHHGAGGGDPFKQPRRVPGGLLGADYAIENGRYRFTKVYGGLNWNPELRAPLTEPGVNVQAGEYLLAVRGQDLRPPTSLYSLFENTANKIVEITVGPNPDGTGARTVSVVPVADELALRNRDWVEGNIKKVDAATGGRVAYVYVPNTAAAGYTYFKRYFYPQSHKEAIIVDERFNGGGLIADYYIDMLRRPYISHWAMRYGNDLKTPTASIQGPKVMLINETAGSGGDLLPWMWHQFGLGPLIGKRTWGGLVGHWTGASLLDGGGVSSPNLAIWTEDGWVVENVGVPPDVEVEQWPADVIAGRDPQLEKAIEVILEELSKNAPPKVARPEFPVRVKR